MAVVIGWIAEVNIGVAVLLFEIVSARATKAKAKTKKAITANHENVFFINF